MSCEQSRSGLLSRQHELQKILEQKNCFKLICGAGNENLQEVERLVALYSAAGCKFFDFAANEEVLKAAQRGLDFSIPKEKQKDYHFCVSIGTKGDQHVQKAFIDKEKCTGCGKCIEICPQGAVKERGKREEEREKNLLHCEKWSDKTIQYEIVEKYCIGCLRCQNICEYSAISFHLTSFTFQHSSLFPLSYSLACIELHASATDETEVNEIWDYLNTNFEGMLSLCIGRQKLSDEKILARVKRLVEKRKPYTTIIQADGIPMSGVNDDYETTMPAIEMGELIQTLNLPIYLLLSGGTNSKTSELAKKHGVNINGVAMGSYARKIVKEYIEREDFWTNKAVFNEALKTAQKLIQ